MEKKKQIWGYTAIFDPKLIGKKQFIFLVKFDLSVDTEDFLKIVTSAKQIKDHEEKYGFKTSMFLHGKSDMAIIIWAKDVIEAKKLMNNIMKIFRQYVKEIDLLEVLAIFRDHNVVNPNMIDEWNKLLI